MNVMHYDKARRRLWIAGQRCHHGATGALIAGAAGVGLVAAKAQATTLVALLGTGSLLMVHDWHDRRIWFERGWGTQP